jgi:hypothetical protein
MLIIKYLDNSNKQKTNENFQQCERDPLNLWPALLTVAVLESF